MPPASGREREQKNRLFASRRRYDCKRLHLEPKRQVETELFRFYHCYHVLPPDMAANPDLTAAQQRLLAEISACRSVIDADEDLTRYRVLVGFDNISRYMWEKVNYDYKETGIERAQDIKALAGTCPSARPIWPPPMIMMSSVSIIQAKDVFLFRNAVRVNDFVFGQRGKQGVNWPVHNLKLFAKADGRIDGHQQSPCRHNSIILETSIDEGIWYH